jgi:hypothetical protein
VNLVLASMAVMVACAVSAVSQGYAIEDVGVISGSLQTDAQSYRTDSLIGAPDVPEQILSNTFVNILFTRGNFSAGMRFESYQNPLLGIDPRYGTTGAGTGIGIPYRFARYQEDFFDVTVGNFYEQFGSGMVLRLYEERNLGFDNSIDGLRLKFMPTEGLTLTGFIGRQRAFFELSEGIMRGADATINLDQIGGGILPDGVVASVGASVVSRYQPDKNPFYNLPENVLAWSARGNLVAGDFQVEFEYANKINDPGITNSLSFNSGNGAYLNASWATSGVGLSAAVKRIDNMDFRSDRTAAGFAQQVNYLPALTKQHTWRLITLYPYATQPTGEFGLQADATFTIPAGSFLGDDATTITLNASTIHAIDTTNIDAFHYTAEFWWADRIFFRDFNAEIQRKFGNGFKLTLAYINIDYDQDVIERRASINETKFGVINANFLVAELWFKTSKNQALRSEIQWMGVSHQDGAELALQNGDWAMLLLEYSTSPSWFFTVFDEYNYGNADESLKIHYPNASVAFVKDALRVQGGYGRVRGGILCVGGICRPVPASNGLTLSVTFTF